tara:strand:+ start:65 stop:202 length:138 start_codon:yes stop_codon:yes gene_type:complete
MSKPPESCFKWSKSTVLPISHDMGADGGGKMVLTVLIAPDPQEQI